VQIPPAANAPGGCNADVLSGSHIDAPLPPIPYLYLWGSFGMLEGLAVEAPERGKYISVVLVEDVSFKCIHPHLPVSFHTIFLHINIATTSRWVQLRIMDGSRWMLPLLVVVLVRWIIGCSCRIRTMLTISQEV
jgi:hypothetical protein